MKKIQKRSGIILLTGILFILFSQGCSNNKTEQNQEEEQETAAAENSTPTEEAPATVTDPMQDKGIGPVTSLEVGPISKDLAKKGQTIFETKCAACHKLDTKYVGPALSGVTKRRSPEWIMNMILNPVEMTQKDPLAKQLLEEHLTQMTFQDVTEDDARAILEYFREQDEQSK